jgi:integrase
LARGFLKGEVKMVALTEKSIGRLLTKGPGRYRDVGGPIRGLHLQITRGHTASWLLRFERGGRERWCGLGAYPLVSLKTARERARDARLNLLDNVDPIELKRAARTAAALEAARTITFEAALREYLASHERKWTKKHAEDFSGTLHKYALPILGRLPVAEIDTGLVLRCVEPIWHTKTTTADRVRNRIEVILDWAKVRSYRTGDNPAAWRGHLEHLLPAKQDIQKTVPHAAVPFAQIPALMADLRRLDSIGARALEFTVLTAARSGEVVHAVWDEIDLEARIWRVPGARMKARREHVVPLAPAAIALLRALPTEKGNARIFVGSSRAGLSGMVLPRILKQLGREETVHGLRSSFRDWAGEQTAFAPDVIEHALAHAVGSGTERAYARGTLLEKRRKLMEAWARYCGTTPEQAATAGVVVALRQA